MITCTPRWKLTSRTTQRSSPRTKSSTRSAPASDRRSATAPAVDPQGDTAGAGGGPRPRRRGGRRDAARAGNRTGRVRTADATRRGAAPKGSLLWLVAAIGVALIGQQVGGVFLSPTHSGAVGAFLVVPFAMLASRIKASPPAIVMMLAAFRALVPGALSFESASQAA